MAFAQKQVLLKGDTSSSIRLFGDARLEKLSKKKVSSSVAPRGNYRTKGYRVQIYNGTDRTAANDARSRFMRYNPGLRSYLLFKAPYFRVRVGDFVNKNDATSLADNIGTLFESRAVLQDVINVSPKKQ